MMALIYKDDLQACDIARDKSFFVSSNAETIKSAVLMSIFSNKGGWWHDPKLGSSASKAIQDGKADKKTIDAVLASIKESLAWMIEKKFASKIDAKILRQEMGTLQITIEITKNDEQIYATEIAWEAFINAI